MIRLCGESHSRSWRGNSGGHRFSLGGLLGITAGLHLSHALGLLFGSHLVPSTSLGLVGGDGFGVGGRTIRRGGGCGSSRRIIGGSLGLGLALGLGVGVVSNSRQTRQPVLSEECVEYISGDTTFGGKLGDDGTSVALSCGGHGGLSVEESNGGHVIAVVLN